MRLRQPHQQYFVHPISMLIVIVEKTIEETNDIVFRIDIHERAVVSSAYELMLRASQSLQHLLEVVDRFVISHRR